MNRYDTAIKTLVLGIGNILKKDDGVGVHVANILRDEYPDLVESAEIIDGGTAGLDCLPLMTGRERIIVIDALKAKSEPGSLYHFRAKHLIDDGSPYSQHQLGLASIVRMLKLLGHEPEIEVIGIVPGDIASDEIGLTPAVASSARRAALMVRDMIGESAQTTLHGGR
ncbi:MAG: hydrogenase maturation protease [Spirochaetes bacterium]|nr:hydrogenase maturation protease [Spirochaetota bacterium]